MGCRWKISWLRRVRHGDGTRGRARQDKGGRGAAPSERGHANVRESYPYSNESSSRLWMLLRIASTNMAVSRSHRFRSEKVGRWPMISFHVETLSSKGRGPSCSGAGVARQVESG